MLAFIQWAPDPTVFTIGNYSIRWYALCWCCALLLAYWNMHRLYRDQRIPEEKFEPLFFYCFVFLLLGARLGQCLFYEPVFYLTWACLWPFGSTAGKRKSTSCACLTTWVWPRR